MMNCELSSQKEILTGNAAAAEAVKLARVQTIPIYPITPQTTIVEHITEFKSNGELDAEVIRAEGEHGAMGAAIGSSIGGSRTFTATGSQGLAYMHESVAQATGYRTPIVMAVGNRRLGSTWSIHPDYTDVMPETNLGWIVCFVESNQEVLDTIIQAYRIAEDKRVMLPVMVNMDGFYLTYSREPVKIPEQNLVDDFLPEYTPPRDVLDPDVRSLIDVPEGFTSYERVYEDYLNQSKTVIEEVNSEFCEKFGRNYGGLLETYKLNGAKSALLTVGSMTTAARRAVDKLRKDGFPIGLIKLRFYRPFPEEKLVGIAKDLKAVGVVERAIDHGTNSGPLANDLRSTLYGLTPSPEIHGHVAGMGGEDVTVEDFENIGKKLVNGDISEPDDKKSCYIEHPPPPKPDMIEFEEKKPIYSGGGGCVGCGISLLMKHVLDVIGKDIVLTIPPSCAGACYSISEVLGVEHHIANYAAGADWAVGTYKALGNRQIEDKVISAVWAGDGGTHDIGFQALSAAAERNDPILYFCYNNQAYMNTGTQRSSATPYGARTSTTPIGKAGKGKRVWNKDVALMMTMHNIPYIATASPAFITDLRAKVKKAKEIVLSGQGMVYLELLSPCPTGWKTDSSKTVELAKLAVETGTWPVYEVDHGKLKMTEKPGKLKSVEKYLSMQGRFSHLDNKTIGKIQEKTESSWKNLLWLEEKETLPWYTR